jgi:hypothetical protein
VNESIVVDEDTLVGAASAFTAASEPDVPQIDPPSTGLLTLMWGVPGEGDETAETRNTRAEVRELNGADEEAIARLKESSPSFFTDLVDVVLRRAVETVGDTAITPVNGMDVLGDLLVADREILFKEILLATFGSERSYENVECPECSGLNDIAIDVEGLTKVTHFDGDPRIEVTLRDGRKLAIHYPLGKDQKFVYGAKEETSGPGYNTRMIARCVDTVNAEPFFGEQSALKFALELGMADRRKIVTALASGPSVKFREVEVPCTECGEAIPFVFGWADLL